MSSTLLLPLAFAKSSTGCSEHSLITRYHVFSLVVVAFVAQSVSRQFCLMLVLSSELDVSTRPTQTGLRDLRIGGVYRAAVAIILPRISLVILFLSVRMSFLFHVLSRYGGIHWCRKSSSHRSPKASWNELVSRW